MSNKSGINYNEMHKLNIENLFSSKGGVKPHTNGKLDINTLFKKCEKVNDNFVFDSEILLESIKIKKQKILDCHLSIFKTCCESIISANSSGITDIIHEIPEHVPDVLDFNSKKCLVFIKNKLREQKISSTLLTNTRIFITWNDLEEKINADKDEKSSKSSSEENISNYDNKNSY
jgi:hypothetical protein